MNIGIGLKHDTYTPEAFAYAAFLKDKGWNVQLDYEELLDGDLDAHIYVMGIRPFYLKSKRKDLVEIHEYQSLSTPNFAKSKDLAKRFLNKKPAARVFLNSTVKDQLKFNDKTPYILRDMGVDNTLFLPPPKNPRFDLIYCGSIGRVGLINELLRLAKIGLKILIVGDAPANVINACSEFPFIEFTGRVQRHELPEIYQQARAGLNFTPNIYPFNIQTSTKTLEYCAAGLGIVSNYYEWADTFSSERKAEFLWTEKILSRENFDEFNFNKIDVHDLEWSRILTNIELDIFFREVITSKYR
ncbi:glycosyltransferase family 4 protein [Pseudomonas fluorescens]|uniref:Glycosyltransferase n=1 Tax=Pseudomonas fluorescens TaxID=294 RepID=A0A5E7CFL0_PSEFL|nr:glycosyltransferase family 4 protein [Pseudomonas fluorescens]VVO03226.1 hypothetical protein PS710_02836 [Pseudomonas fluorescens]